MKHTADDPRVRRILEACYDAICAGSEPDLAALCAEAPELLPRVERLLRRERDLVQACSRRGDEPPQILLDFPPRIGDFTILEPIGIGGMSHVFRARQEPLGREVALKVLRDDLVASATGRLRFAREAAITASLEHPNIVPVYAAGEAGGRVYLAMKLLRGRSLDHHDGALSPDQVARIGIDVATALQAAHDVGVVHRDLKPANIIDENGRAFVVDFGLAAFANRASLLTQPNATPGTLIYLPPEVARRRTSGLDPRADVYALGATLYELLAGRPPFDPSNPVLALHQILHHDPQPLGLRGRDRDIETIVRRAMAKVPHRRFETAAELAAELHRYRTGVPIHTRRPNLLARGWRRIVRRPAVSALVAVTSLLVVALIVQTGLHRRAQQESLREQTAAARAAIVAGDLAIARRRLDALAAHPLATQVPDALATAWSTERDLQVLTVALQNPLVRDHRTFLAELCLRIDRRTHDEPLPPRAEALLAIAEAGSATARSEPSRQLYADLPRVAAALQARFEGRSPLGELQRLGKRSGGVQDHLLAAVVLRGAGAAEREVETELRRAVATGFAPLLLDSLAISLEAQGRHRQAYDVVVQLLDDPVCGATAAWAAARLAASLGHRDAAREHLRAALARHDSEPLVRWLGTPSELQVLSELEHGEQFWSRWRAAAEQNGNLPQYWRCAGYVASDEAGDPESYAVARGYFERGLACDPSPLQRAGLDVALLQLEWRRLAGWLEAAARPAPLTVELHRLAEAAEAQSERLAIGPLPRTLLADALVIAARARHELGDAPRAHDHLDRAADLDDPTALMEFATQIAVRAAAQLRNGGEEPGAAGSGVESLSTSAALALERAKRVLTMVEQGRAVDVEVAERAAQAALWCAAYLGEARCALPWALAFRGDATGDEAALADLVGALRRQGGLLLDRLAPAVAHQPARLQQALAAVEHAWQQGAYCATDAAAVLAGWQQQLHGMREDPTWAAFWHAVHGLEQQLRATR